MPTPRANTGFWRGVVAALPFMLVVAPFGMIFGVIAIEAGLNMAETMGMTILVIAGASQLTAIQLMTEEAPVLIVIASALAVNLRMAMYSASLAPYLGPAKLWQRALIAYMNVDQTYALSVQDFEDRPKETLSERLGFFFGTSAVTIPLWIISSYLGALLGATIPPEYGLDFAVPIAFLAIIGPALRSLAHVAAALTSILVAMLLAGLPWNLWLLIAGVLGMIVGAEVERQMAKRGGAQP